MRGLGLLRRKSIPDPYFAGRNFLFLLRKWEANIAMVPSLRRETAFGWAYFHAKINSDRSISMRGKKGTMVGIGMIAFGLIVGFVSHI